MRAETTTLEEARWRLRRLGIQVPVLVAAAAVAFGGVSAVAPGTAIADPPSSSTGGDGSSGLRHDLSELRKLLQQGSVSAGVRANRLIEKIAATLPGCVGKCFAEKVFESKAPPGAVTLLRYLGECTAECYVKSKIKSPEQAHDALMLAEAAEKRARKALKKAQDARADTTGATREYEATKAKTAKATAEWSRTLDRELVARKVAELSAEQDAKKRKKGNGGDTDPPTQSVKPTTPPKGGPGSTEATGRPVQTPVKPPTKKVTKGVKTSGTQIHIPQLKGAVGRRGAATASLEIIGELANQALQEHVSDEHQKVLAKALKDPDLRKRIIDYYKGYKNANPFGQLIRGLEKTGFGVGTALEVAPKLIDFEKKRDTQLKAAAKAQAASEAKVRDAQIADRKGGFKPVVKATTRPTTKAQAASEAKVRDAQIADRKGGFKPVVKATTRPTTKAQTANKAKNRDAQIAV